MKITIITVTYNSDRFLEDCIKSVINQDYNDIEYIIVDGSSKDNTLSIIDRYSQYISKWISEKDNGMYDAINKGMKMATGDVIGILNSDDMLASNDVIRSIVTSFKQKKVDCIYGDLIYVDQLNINKIIRYWKGITYKRSRFNYGWMPAHPTFYITKASVEKYGNYATHYYTAADYEFMSRLLYRYRVSAYYLPKLLVKMRVGGASNISLKNRLRANRRDYLAMKSNKVPLAFIVSILKPLIKLPQFYKKKSQEN